MHRAAEKAVIAHFVKHGLIEAHGKTLDELVALRLGAVFMPHGLGHFMGLDTHDVGGYPQVHSLSIEYFAQHGHMRYHDVGR